VREVGGYRASHGVASCLLRGSALGRRRGASTPPVVRPNQVARTALYVVSTIHTVASGAFLPPLAETVPGRWSTRRNPYRHRHGMPTGPRLAGGGGPSPSLSFLFRYPYSRRAVRPRLRCIGRVHRSSASSHTTVATARAGSAAHGPFSECTYPYGAPCAVYPHRLRCAYLSSASPSARAHPCRCGQPFGLGGSPHGGDCLAWQVEGCPLVPLFPGEGLVGRQGVTR
jgi:hypothetical protein